MSDEYFNSLPEGEQAWITKTAEANELEIEEVVELHDREAKALEESGIKDMCETEAEFFNWVRGAVNGNIDMDLKVPKAVFQYLHIGNYPPQKRKSGKKIVELVGFAHHPESGLSTPEFALSGAWEENIDKRLDADFCSTYNLKVAYNPDDKEEGRYAPGVRNFTVFKPEALPWAKDHDAALDLLKKSVPALKSLDEAESQLSRMIVSDNDYEYVDNLDIRCVKGLVMSFNQGVNKKGLDWGKYVISDATNGSFVCWIDPKIAHKCGAGKGSMIELFGVLRAQYDDDGILEEVQMTACAVNAIKVVGELDKENEKVKEQRKSLMNKPAPKVNMNMMSMDEI